jgi:septum formation protein
MGKRPLAVQKPKCGSSACPDDIETYLKCEEWRGKAGGYAIQGRAEAFVRYLAGSHSGVIGLPLYETVTLLQGAGFPVYHNWMTQTSDMI